MDNARSPIAESELDEIAGGGKMPDGIRAAYAVLFGTGICAALYSLQAETQESGGAKKLADAIYNDGEDFVIKMPLTGNRFLL
ncbi:MAG TPA: hypothetical protein VF797_03040 [Noviherbaspirillum sp.]